MTWWRLGQSVIGAIDGSSGPAQRYPSNRGHHAPRCGMGRRGPAVGRPAGLLILGHGAGGGVEAADLLAARRAALEAEWAVARVTQPYRVAGRRSPPAGPVLDGAWLPVVTKVRSGRGLGLLPVVFGGRSSGARVACRTASAGHAAGVLALAFPLHPPGHPERSRVDGWPSRRSRCLSCRATGTRSACRHLPADVASWSWREITRCAARPSRSAWR